MSAQASGWVWSHSPLKGAALLCHAAIADSVNDQNTNEFWMSIANLAKKARVERRTAGRAVEQMVDEGLLELLEERPGGSTRYRFVMLVGVGSENPGEQVGPGREDPGVGRENPGPGSREPTNPREPKRTQGRPRKARAAPIPDEFKLRPEDWDWATENCPTIDSRMSTKQFVTFWRADGRLKVNWLQAWRNWLLKDEERAAPSANGRTATRTYL